MHPLAEDRDYVYTSLEAPDHAETGRFFAEVFGRDEPISAHVGLGPDEWRRIWHTSFYAGLVGGPSVLARSRRTGAIVGVRLAGDLHAHWPSTALGRFEHVGVRLVDRYASTLVPILDRFYGAALPMAVMADVDMRAIDRWYTTHRPAALDPRARAGEVLYMLGVAVRPEDRGRQLGRRMTALTHERAIRQGFRHAVVKCSGPHSRRLFEALGYRAVFELAYDQYRYAGRRPLAGLDSDGACFLERPLWRVAERSAA